MAKCEVCGNEYDKAFDLIAAGQRHTFDSFECAIQAIAPICEHCQCRVIGHGVEVGGPLLLLCSLRTASHLRRCEGSRCLTLFGDGHYAASSDFLRVSAH
jgi:hypothetical protein